MYGVLMNENDHYFLALLICHDFHRAFHDLAVRTQDHLTDTILSLANFGMLDLTNLMKSIVELFDGQLVGVHLDFVEYCPHSAFFPDFPDPLFSDEREELCECGVDDDDDVDVGATAFAARACEASVIAKGALSAW